MVGIDKIPESKLRWNTNEEILLYLSHAGLNLHLLRKKQLMRPKNGAILLYDRTKVRYKSDGYDWKKRKDGKNVREDHMKLKVNGIECLYGAYVHNESVPNFHRRCYWKLKMPKIVLVHYLYTPEETSSPLTSTQFQSAISQIKNIFNVSENQLLSNNTEELCENQPAGFPPSSSPSSPDKTPPDTDNCKASQLLLILNKNGAEHQLKKLVYQDRNIVSEDKNTQTEKCDKAVDCLSPVPCSSSSRLELDSSSSNPLLVGQHNPILNSSINNILMDDCNSFSDPILANSNDSAKLFELFEESAAMSNNQGFLGGGGDILALQNALSMPEKTSVPDLEMEVSSCEVPVGNKRKHSTPPEHEPTTSSSSSVQQLNGGGGGGGEVLSLPQDHGIIARGAVLRSYDNTVYNNTDMLRGGPVLPTSEFLVQISAISPDWSYVSGGEKVVLVGDWEELQGRCSVMFGNTMVPAHQLRTGVIQVICPGSSHPGLVTVHIVTDGVIVTNSATKFTYKELHAPSNWLNVVDSNFKYSLINRLEALESQVRMLSSPQYCGDLQSRMCSISLPILRKLSRSMKLPRAPRGLRLVHLAAAVGYSRLLLLLLRFPQLPECNPSSLDDMGNNALVWACVGGHTSSIYILLRTCPRLRTTRDGWGRSIRDLYRSSASMGGKGENAARTIQLHYRTYKQKKQNAAAIRIQTRFRTYKQQCNFEQMRRAVVIIQQSYRDHMKQKEVAAKTIQRCWRAQGARHRRHVLGLTGNSLGYF